MPVYLDRVPSSDLLQDGKLLYGQAFGDAPNCETPSLDIGIINNMPDGAMKSTERQFLQLLDAAAGSLIVNVTFYALYDVPRSKRAARHIEGSYAPMEDLWDRHLDGLIVTGAEPQTSDLRNESYWLGLTAVLEWAKHNTYSSIWSCLAAHAAVLHLDGIQRRRLNDKRFGLFGCDQVRDYWLTAGLPPRLVVPHSRWNDLPAAELLDRGYEILTHSDSAGVDAFVKRNQSLYIFFQGHPEYESHTLLLEYRRDIGRYLRGERDVYPSMPANCLSPGEVHLLEELHQLAVRERREELLAEFPADLIGGGPKSSWSVAAASIYRNWLTYLCEARTRRPYPEVARSKPAQIRLAAGR